MTGDVLQHHDGIVHHKAGGDGERHEREVVQAVAHEVHDPECSGQRHRHRHAGDDRGAQAPQEHADHQHHQGHRQGQRTLDFQNGCLERWRAVGHDLHLNGLGDGGLQARQQGAHALHRLDDVGTGLLVEDQQNGRFAIGRAIVAQILHRVDDLGHIAQPHRTTFAITKDQRDIVGRCSRLVVGLDLPGSVGIFQYPLGTVGVVRHHGCAHVLQRQAVCGQPFRVELDANCGQGATAQGHLSHPVNLRQSLRQHGGGHVIHLAPGHGLRGQRQDHDGCFGRIDFAIGGVAGHARRKQGPGGIDGRQDVAGSPVDVTVEFKLQGHPRVALGGKRGHLRHPCDRTQGAFQRRGHRRRHGLRAGAGQGGLNRDGRKLHLRQGCDRQLEIRQQTRQRHRQGEQRGRHWTSNEGGGKVHLTRPLAQARYEPTGQTPDRSLAW